jgi:hypothetical protein
MARTDSNGVAVLQRRVRPDAEVVTELAGHRLASRLLRRMTRDTFYVVCELGRTAKRTVAGHVVSGVNGLPVTGALVQLGKQAVQTDVAGRFALRGTYQGRTDLQVLYPRHPNVTRTLLAGRGDTVWVRAALFDSTATGSLVGRVSDTETGEAMPYCTILLTDTPPLGAAADNNGRYQVERIPVGDYQVLVCAMAYLDNRRWVSVTPGPPVQVDWRLAPDMIP